jgi:hypothetical protein
VLNISHSGTVATSGYPIDPGRIASTQIGEGMPSVSQLGDVMTGLNAHGLDRDGNLQTRWHSGAVAGQTFGRGVEGAR